MIGQTLGSYRIVSVIGEGGMGTVYLARHTMIGRKAAIKVLRGDMTGRQDIVSRFFTEARATSLIKHAGIVDIFDFGVQPDASAYIVMEYLEGEDLRARMTREGPPPLELMVTILRQLAGALAAAHAVGIVHRDLKPDNVFLVADPDVVGGVRVKILDFGIAKLVGHASQRFKTSTGSLLGTPVYMSPEQCRGGSVPVDHRADVYALGCIAYEMACGRPPFLGDGMGDLIIAHLQQPPAPPRSLNPALPASLEAVILHLLAKDPAERPQTMDAVLHELGGGPPPVAAARPATPVPPPPARTPPQSTTLGLAASQVQRLAARPKRFWPVVGVLGLAGALAVAYPLLRRRPPVARPAPQAVPPIERPVAAAMEAAELVAAPVLPDAAAAVARADASAAVEIAPPPTPVIEIAPPPDPGVRLTIRSRPDGAEVFDERGVSLGRTPLVQTVPRGGVKATFLLRLAGHKEARVVLATDHDGAATATLARERTRARRRDGQPVLDDRAVDPFGR